MFVRMNEIARKIALISLLVSLPLLLIAGVLLGQSVEPAAAQRAPEARPAAPARRVRARAIGATLLLAIGLGGLVGGILGAILGTLVPLSIYIGGLPPLDAHPEDPGADLSLAMFLAVGIAIALADRAAAGARGLAGVAARSRHGA